MAEKPRLDTTRLQNIAQALLVHRLTHGNTFWVGVTGFSQFVAVIVLFFAVWAAATLGGFVSKTFLADPITMVRAGWALIAEQGFTANVPLADLNREDVLFATHHDGVPLTLDHGYPLRLVVPHLYAWKSVKWVRALEFLEHDQPGFWEQNGYHMYGDPWKEQRHSQD